MIKILQANWLVGCGYDYKIIENGAIVFDEKIIDVDTIENIKQKYQNENIEDLGENSVLMPGLINSHIHLEFSGNKTTLQYGNFVKWLFSVIANREELIEKADEKLIDKTLKDIINTGTTTIGAISSYGFDMNSCIKSPINTVYFTEVLGSKADMIDTLFLDFKEKLNSAISNKSDSFIPAIAIHSPYSTHPFMIREVLNIAKENNMVVSSHFQESKSENDWLNKSEGEFKEFFSKLLNQNKSITTPMDFLNQFKDIEHLSFTHCVEANEEELNKIKELNATIIHCPNSNRLLTNSSLNLKYLDNINIAMGTDGLSSNYSLSMFDEIRNAVFINNDYDINELSNLLLKSATKGGADMLGLRKGILKKDYDADIISFNTPDKIENKEDLAVAIILHTKDVKRTYIKGKNERVC
ncbi:MAG: metal-dependent hydrolase [Campylobacterota bacterium]|nr:metal-dependent hydrolase [Campylobacterota bacterium]